MLESPHCLACSQVLPLRTPAHVVGLQSRLPPTLPVVATLSMVQSLSMACLAQSASVAIPFKAFSTRSKQGLALVFRGGATPLSGPQFSQAFSSWWQMWITLGSGQQDR